MLLNRVDVLQTPNGPTLSVVRTRRGPAHAAAIVADRVALVVGLALLAWSVYTVVQMVQ
jgi:hypothetical protein